MAAMGFLKPRGRFVFYYRLLYALSWAGGSFFYTSGLIANLPHSSCYYAMKCGARLSQVTDIHVLTPLHSEQTDGNKAARLFLKSVLDHRHESA